MKTFSIITISLGILACMFFGYACKSRTSDATLKVLADQVMAVHDEVMPKMGTLHTLKKKLSNKSEEILEAEADNMSQSLQEIAKHQSALEDAEDKMMEWMHSYDRNWHEKPGEEAKLYLTEEKKRISEVKTAILESITNAEKFLAGGE